jgi:hypothetical protein
LALLVLPIVVHALLLTCRSGGGSDASVQSVWPRARAVLAKGVGGFLGAQWLATRFLAGKASEDAWPEAYKAAFAAVAVLITAAAASREPARNCALAGSFVGHAAAVATQSPALYFYSLGFFFTVCQGVSHRISGEEATLLQLNVSTIGKSSEGRGEGGGEKDDSKEAKEWERLGFEWAHVIYFPSLLLMSVHASLTGKTVRAARS